MANSTLTRTLHDAGLAAWFGGSLMGAVGLNAAAGAVDDPKQAGRVANVGWNKWTPVNAGAIGALLIGSVGQIGSNAERIAGQKGVAGMSVVKTALTAAAMGATAYSRLLGRKLAQAGDVPAEGGTTPAASTPPELADAQRKLKIMQWVVPASTGLLLAVSSYAGEQQRASEVAKGIKGRLSLSRA
ncbi:MAG TPA: hypothetical protein VE781_04215 [Kineosporiaceae bacterium]|nr:hypothetical protein [Kineosporiaceae bacterium]